MTPPPSPEVSVVMGVYNEAAHLSRCLDALFQQEGVALEIIAVNDGSTDDSGALLDDAAARDPRLRVVHGPNRGLTEALAQGCRLARAPWIARQDADDTSYPQRLRRQLEVARGPGRPVLVGCGALLRGPGGEHLATHIPPTDPASAAQQILRQGQTLSPHGTMLFSREAYHAVGGYRPAFRLAQDLDLSARLAALGPVATLPDLLYEHRVSPSSLSGCHADLQAAYRQLILRSIRRRHSGSSEEDLLEQARQLGESLPPTPAGPRPPSFRGLYFIGACLRTRHPDQAAPYLAQAWRTRPWSVRAAIRYLQARLAARQKVPA